MVAKKVQCLRVKVNASMSLRIHYEYSMACHARSMAENGSEKLFKCVLAMWTVHGKSPCFLDAPS